MNQLNVPVDDLTQLGRQFGARLDATQLAAFRRYLEVLQDWNQRFNLTRITQPDEVAIQHFLDSLSCLLVFPPNGRRLIDVGTGAGFPGIPLKIARPDLQVTLLESTAKKTSFIAALVSELALEKVDVVTARAEDLGHVSAQRERYDIAVSRAVAPLVILAEYCLPFVRVGGRMIAQKTAGIDTEIRAADYAIKALGGRLIEQRAIALPGLGSDRLLVVVEKVERTPGTYPRKPGTPAKAPLVAKL